MPRATYESSEPLDRIRNLEVMTFGANLDDISDAQFEVGDDVILRGDRAHPGSVVGLGKNVQGQYKYAVYFAKTMQGFPQIEMVSDEYGSTWQVSDLEKV